MTLDDFPFYAVGYHVYTRKGLLVLVAMSVEIAAETVTRLNQTFTLYAGHKSLGELVYG